MEELLDQEEALAIQRITESVHSTGEELCSAAELRPTIRRHPFLAVGLGAAAGFFGGPLLVRSSRRLLTKLPATLGALSGRASSLQGIALASLRAVRAPS